MPPPSTTKITVPHTCNAASQLKLIGSDGESKSGSVGAKLGSVELLFGPELYTELYTELSSGDASGENKSSDQPVSDQEQQLQLPVPGRRPISLASQHASKGRRQQRTTGQPPGQPLLPSNSASDREHQRQLRQSPSQSPRLHSTTSHMYTRRSIPPTMAAGTARLSGVVPPTQALEQALSMPPEPLQPQPQPQPQPTATDAATRRTPNAPATPTRAALSAAPPPSIFCSVNLHGAQHDAMNSTAPSHSPSIAKLGSSRAGDPTAPIRQLPAAAPYPPFSPSSIPHTNLGRSPSHQSLPLEPGVHPGVRNGEGVVTGVRVVSRVGHASLNASPAHPPNCVVSRIGHASLNASPAHPQAAVHETESPSWSPPNMGPISWALPNMGLPEPQSQPRSRATFMGQIGLPDLPNMGLPNFDHFVNYGRSLVGGRSMTPPPTTPPVPNTTPSPMSASASARVARATSTHLDRRKAGMRIACGGQLSPTFKSTSPRYARR